MQEGYVLSLFCYQFNYLLRIITSIANSAANAAKAAKYV